MEQGGRVARWREREVTAREPEPLPGEATSVIAAALLTMALLTMPLLTTSLLTMSLLAMAPDGET